MNTIMPQQRVQSNIKRELEALKALTQT